MLRTILIKCSVSLCASRTARHMHHYMMHNTKYLVGTSQPHPNSCSETISIPPAFLPVKQRLHQKFDLPRQAVPAGVVNLLSQRC